MADENPAGAPPPNGEPKGGEEPLAAPGLAALASERTARQEAEKALRAVQAERDAAVAKAEGREAEYAAEVKAREEIERRFNERIIHTELRAAARELMADPDDVFAFVKVSDFEVNADGEVDAKAITEAISALVKRKPYLAARREDDPNQPGHIEPDPSQGARTPGHDPLNGDGLLNALTSKLGIH